MFGLDNKSGINVMPPIAPADSQTPLWFTEGGAGLSATYPGQDWFNQIQAELLNVLKAADISPQKGNLNQLSSAISKLAGAYAVPIVQATGPSLTSVMSQKAVTDLANTKQPKGKYADGDRFQVGSNNASVTPPGGTYSFAISDSGEIFLWDGSKSVFRVSVSGEIMLGSMDYSRLKNVPLVQTTGNSTTSFMSQKATSDLLIATGELRDVIGQRTVNNTYINSSSRPRFVTITGDSKETGSVSVVVNGITIQGLSTGGVSTLPFYCSFLVPVGGSYRLNSTGAFNLGRWTELS